MNTEHQPDPFYADLPCPRCGKAPALKGWLGEFGAGSHLACVFCGRTCAEMATFEGATREELIAAQRKAYAREFERK